MAVWWVQYLTIGTDINLDSKEQARFGSGRMDGKTRSGSTNIWIKMLSTISTNVKERPHEVLHCAKNLGLGIRKTN